MIIYPDGLLEGDRLAACSDEAQLHFPRLVALANGFARMELNAKAIVETAYGNFHVKPTRQQLTGWLQEFAKAHLLFVYTDSTGTPWGQWCGIPDRMLPRFKTAVDKRSPVPPEHQFSAYENQYAEKKKASGDFLSISDDFGNVPKSSEASETFPLGIGIGIGVGKGIGVGEEQKQIHSSSSDKSEPHEASPASAKKSTRRGNKAASASVTLPAFVPETEWREWLRVKKGAKTPYAQQLAIDKLTGFHADRYDVAAILKRAIEGAWSSVFVDEDTPKRKVVYEEVDPATFWAGTGIPAAEPEAA